ncbi:unnamed protein product, partial [Ectocarpus fasciculatus]
ELQSFLFSKQRVICITGAGISTRSGIPDYRGPNGSYGKGHKPMQHHDFVTKESARKRYWSRSIIGIKTVMNAEPNGAHRALFDLQQRGIVKSIVTQNVDGLHQKAGSTDVIDLHGRIDGVSCISCGNKLSRVLYQQELEKLNEEYKQVSSTVSVEAGTEARPDGDVDIGDMDSSKFTIPPCSLCGGVYKPDVVFFGDTVPRDYKEKAMHEIENSDGVLVVGSSLEVFSAFRLIRRAIELRKPIAVLNLGETRLHRFSRDTVLDDAASSSSQPALQPL